MFVELTSPPRINTSRAEPFMRNVEREETKMGFGTVSAILNTYLINTKSPFKYHSNQR